MRILFCCIFVCSSLFPTWLSAQKEKRDERISTEAWERIRLGEDTIGVLSFATLNDTSELNRMAACRKLILTLVAALKSENSFFYSFKQLNTISIQYPPDSSFRIFTWQLYLNDNDYRYFGAIQLNQKALKLFPLIDRSMNFENAEDTTLTNENWYGCLYYNILPFESVTGTKYLVFGYDAYQFWRKRKLIDVLAFDPVTGKPQFGAPVFVKDTPEEKWTLKRFILEYSSETSLKLNYEKELDMIVFDRLVEIPSNNPENGGMLRVPDGFYHTFKLENGIWNFMEDLPNEILEEAPRPKPVLGNGKTILGNR